MIKIYGIHVWTLQRIKGNKGRVIDKYDQNALYSWMEME